MNENQNRDIAENLITTLRLNPLYDTVPSAISPVIQPTIEVYNPELIIRTLDAGGTMYTTRTDKDFYLTNVMLSAVGQTDDGSGKAYISFNDADNVARYIYAAYSGENLLTGNGTAVSVQFPFKGIRLLRGSQIVAEGQTSIAGFMIAGYYQDAIKQ